MEEGPANHRGRALSRVDATAYLAPYPQRRVRRPILLRLTEHTYPLEPSPEQSWLPIAFRAFARLARGMNVRDVLVIGTGNGLDALGAAEILDLERLCVTDLHEESMAVARENVLAHLEAGEIELSFHAGDLFSCVPVERRFCLVYENLPNIPVTADLNLRSGAIAGRFFDPVHVDVPDLFRSHLLALHYRCLEEARPRIRSGGGVLTAIGGRVPHEVTFELHRACDYEPELVAFDVKQQVRPELVLPSHIRAELQSGIEFMFYAPEAIDLVADVRQTGLEGQELADAVGTELAELALSAQEAYDRTRRGGTVAHSVLMILGKRRAADS
jgi:SAM-dependent methyltransferase